MFSINPFAELSALIPPAILQGYIVLMFILVVGGTILDMMHKKSAQYFFENSEKAKKSAKRTLSGGEKTSLAVATLANEVLTSAEFKVRPARRYSRAAGSSPCSATDVRICSAIFFSKFERTLTEYHRFAMNLAVLVLSGSPQDAAEILIFQARSLRPVPE